MDAPFCSVRSLEIGEPLAGTAIEETDRFLLLEHPGPWGPKGLEDSALPAEVVGYLADLGARHPRLRVQLIRQLGDPPYPERRLFLAACGEDGARLSSLVLPGYEALLDLGLEPWLAGEAAAPGTLDAEPLVLVCVHGKRDRCCALRGMPMYRALSALDPARIFQTTHLGGHRFAATLLVLPTGVCYGRVAPEEAPQLLSASRRAELHDLARVRGRTSYPSEAQAAEVVLRRRLGLLRDDALTLSAVEPLGAGRYRVRFVERGSGLEHAVELARERLPPAPQSCGKGDKEGEGLVALALKGAQED